MLLDRNDGRKWGRRIFVFLALLLILGVNIVRFGGLENAPPGVHPDESIDSVTLQCVATNGMKDSLAPTPFFTLMGYSFKPPTYVYPGVVWVKIFGFSVESIRAFTGFFVVVTIVGLFFLGRHLFGLSYAVWLCLLASISPWIWPVSRFGNDSLVALPFLVWGMYFLFRSNSWRDMALAGLLISGSVYGYSTYRMAVPLFLLLFFLYKWKRREWKLWPGLLFGAIFAVTLIPLVQLTLTGAITQYFNNISIFSKDYLASVGKTGSFGDLWGIYWKIYFMHLTPEYLFLHGGGSVMYLTRFCGLLGWLDVVALMGGLIWAGRLCVFQRIRTGERAFLPFVIMSLAAFFVGILPVGFTHYNVPSVMRISAAWPFAMMFLAFFLWRWSLKVRGLWVALLILACVFFTGYVRDYFANYPKINYMDFGARYKQMAESAKTDLDWVKFVVVCKGDGMKARYYLMRYRQMSCNQANKFYMDVSGYFKSRPW